MIDNTDLPDRILATLRFFDLQELPLTHYEIWKYLLDTPQQMSLVIDDHYELKNVIETEPRVGLQDVLQYIAQLTQQGQIETDKGFYAMPGRKDLIATRLSNYGNGLVRERRVRRYLTLAKHLPFMRGIALAGSQPLGQQRPTSDIDLFIMTDSKFMWSGRTFLTAYFQLLGMRRHGKKIANRFCLNHYLAKPREVDAERNLYKAMEYLKLRPVVYGQTILKFQQANAKWMKIFFPNLDFTKPTQQQSQSKFQKALEQIYIALGGHYIEQKLGAWQLARIRQDKFIFVREDELSFHPESKHEALLSGFFKLHK